MKAPLFAAILVGIAAASAAPGVAASDLFAPVAKVFQHPRCANCHADGERPRHGDGARPHAFNVRRGGDGGGVAGQRCQGCHAPSPIAGHQAKLPPALPKWRMPSAKHPMIFRGRSAGAICRQIQDRRQNGDLNLEQVVRHMMKDPLVLWSFAPGPGRAAVPMAHREFIGRLIAWGRAGAQCPHEEG